MTESTAQDQDEIRQAVRQRYAAEVRLALKPYLGGRAIRVNAPRHAGGLDT